MSTTKKSPAKPAAAPDAPTEHSVVARFESDYTALVLYRNGVRIAAFENGQFATSDPAVIAVLRESNLVREVLDEAAP